MKLKQLLNQFFSLNKIKYLNIILTLLLVSCTTTKEITVTSKVSNKHKVIVWYDKEQKDIWAFSVPIYLEVENKSFLIPREFISHKYIYADKNSGTHTFLYELEANGKLKKKKNFSRKKITPSTKKKYIIYSKHLITNKKYSDQILYSYKNREFKSDSIVLDFFNDFKNKLPDLAENILVKDSLFLSFNNEDKKSKLSTKRIKVPIKL